MPAEKVDGNDVERVRAVAERAVDHARRGDGPAFLECLTYRHLGHSKTDPGAYRPEGELDEWLARDPLTRGRGEAGRGGRRGRRDRRLRRRGAGRGRGGASPQRSADPYPDPAVPATEYAG